MIRLLRFARVAIHLPQRVRERVAIVDGDQRQRKQGAEGEVDVVLRLRRQRSGECARGPHHPSFGLDAERAADDGGLAVLARVAIATLWQTSRQVRKLNFAAAWTAAA